MAAVAFILCIENNSIREQALLLIESIRTFTGVHKDAEIIAISPRGNGVDSMTRRRLDDFGTRYVDLPLNRVCPEYGSANRIYGAAWAAQNSRASTLIILDSDTLFFDEPELLGADCDFAARPVDLKNTSSSGPHDALDQYLEALCRFVPVSIDVLPYITTTIDRAQVRAAYNGGYVAVRRASGILERAAEIFTASVRDGLRPLKGRGLQVSGSTGPVGTLASEYWGSNQMAMAVAAWSITRRVRELDIRYNVPLHQLVLPHHWPVKWNGTAPVHVHYHHLLNAEYSASVLPLLEQLGLAEDGLAWLGERIPLARY